MASDFALLVNGAPLVSPLAIPADGYTNVPVTLQVQTPVGISARDYKISTSCIFKITPVQGLVDAATGRAVIFIGPVPFGTCGDVTVTISAGAHKKVQTFDVRFA